MKILSSTRVGGEYGGTLKRVQHASKSTGTDMVFGVFLPSKVSSDATIPAMFWLSGLTCDDTNFETKAGPKAFEAAEREGIAIVMPDTSPRGEGVPNVDSYDLGQGAGFYVNATSEPYSKNYHMLTYVTDELPAFVLEQFNVGGEFKSISGHSMGGHGALTIALRDPSSWVSVSAFAPICNPTACPWGQKAFGAYLGDVSKGEDHDATVLVSKLAAPLEEYDDILIDQGTSDEFLEGQLLPQNFVEAAAKVGQKVTLNMRPDFDHGYYFIAAFVTNHVAFHAKRLNEKKRRRLAARPSSMVVAEASTAGRPITCRAMVARAPKQPLVVETITVLPPGPGEVRVKVVANALCHTDIYTLDGHDPEGIFPCILGHEAGAVVESVGPGVCTVVPGDHVIPCYTPQCGESTCIFCMSDKTNLCPKIRSTQGQGVMPDGTVRFKDADGKDIFHFMGCSTMSEYTVIAEISCAKIDKGLEMEKACLFGCGVTTGLGAVWNTCKVQVGETVAVFGLGTVGLACVQGAKLAGASKIIAVDVNPKKFAMARSTGATHCVDPINGIGNYKNVQSFIAGCLTPWGVDYSFDCTGNVEVMRAALECAHRGWGESCVIGVAAAGCEICTRPFQLVTGRVWKGTAFGGFKSRRDVPRLVERCLDGEINVDNYISRVFEGVDKYNDAIEALHGGECLRAVVKY